MPVRSSRCHHGTVRPTARLPKLLDLLPPNRNTTFPIGTHISLFSMSLSAKAIANQGYPWYYMRGPLHDQPNSQPRV